MIDNNNLSKNDLKCGKTHIGIWVRTLFLTNKFLFVFLRLCGLILSGLIFSSSNFAAEDSKRQSTNAMIENSDLTPILSKYAPQPCVAVGKSFTILGKNLLPQKTATGDADSQLFIEVDSKRQTLSTQSWSDTEIVAQFPENVRSAKAATVGISSRETRLLSNLILIKICQATQRRTQDQRSQEDSTVIETREQIIQQAEVTGSEQREPTTREVDPTKSPSDNNSRRLANLSREGSLIGTPLPSLQEELKFKQSTSNDNYVTNEIIAASADLDDAKKLAQTMSNFHARVIRRKKMTTLGIVLSTFRLQPGSKVSDIIKQLRQQQPETWIDANHFYQPYASANENRKQLFNNIALTANEKCDADIRIGILDGPVDVSLASLADQKIKQKQVFSRGKKVASYKHGTAVSSLLVGDPQFPGLAGVMNTATLFVGIVMQQDPKDEKRIFATTENLILGIDWLLKQKVQVINLSLGGSRNALLELVIRKTLESNVAIVAAAGNGGAKAPKSYPAAQEGVIAVSAIDTEGVIANDANQGDYIDLVAPGVDVWVASQKSTGRYASGSSMAAPIVAAALARLGGSPNHSVQLFESAKDIGKAGRDPIYGWGLLQFPACAKNL